MTPPLTLQARLEAEAADQHNNIPDYVRSLLREAAAALPVTDEKAENFKLRRILQRVLDHMQFDPSRNVYVIPTIAWMAQPYTFKTPAEWLKAELAALPVEAEGRATGWQPSGREHELKTWPDYYRYLLDGTKTFEYRRDDRGFQVGDVLHLREWEPTFKRYTGREMRRGVAYILNTSKEFVVMSLLPAPPARQEP